MNFSRQCNDTVWVYHLLLDGAGVFSAIDGISMYSYGSGRENISIKASIYALETTRVAPFWPLLSVEVDQDFKTSRSELFAKVSEPPSSPWNKGSTPSTYSNQGWRSLLCLHLSTV